MTRRPGRSAKHYVTTWGETITGLCLRASGRFYPVGKNSPAFGSDEGLAIVKFRKWQSEQGTIQPEPLDDLEITGAQIRHAIEQEKQRIRHLLLHDPKQASVELNIPHLAHHPATPDRPAMTLSDLGEYWKSNARNKQGKKLADKHVGNTLRFWTEFVDCVDVEYVRDITGDLMQKYHDEVIAAFDGGMSPSYVRGRFTAIKTIIGYPMKRTETTDADRAEYRRVLDLCQSLIPPADVTDPKPISVTDYKALLDKADVREKAVLLLGLNCAMHLGEVAGVELSGLDLDAGTYSGRRSKTSHPRVAKLWSRTVDAIREYQELRKGKSPYLFVSQRGDKVSGETLRQRIVKLRKEAKLKDTVTFEGLRDIAYTIAEGIDAHHAKILAGHKTGISDNYVLRAADNPKIVEICEAIEKHFFG